MEVSLDVIKSLDKSSTVRMLDALKEISPVKWRAEPVEMSDLVGVASIPDITRYLIASGHVIQAMELAAICTSKAIFYCCSGQDHRIPMIALQCANQYISLAHHKISKIIQDTQTISDGYAKTDTKHDASSAADAAANMARATQQLLFIENNNSYEYILMATDDALYAIESEPNHKEIMSAIEDDLRKIMNECP